MAVPVLPEPGFDKVTDDIFSTPSTLTMISGVPVYVNVTELNLFFCSSASVSNLMDTEDILPVQSSNSTLALFATLAIDNESALLNSAIGAENVKVSTLLGLEKIEREMLNRGFMTWRT